MRKGGVARQNERSPGAIMSVDFKDEVMREKGGRGGGATARMRSGAISEWRALVLQARVK